MLLRLLRPTDLADAMHLKESAGWNQTEDDWLRLMHVEPQGCFAVEVGNRVVATTTAICYGDDLAWIGMVLTLPEHRGRGYARQLMERALHDVEARGMAWIKLDATDLGAPLYRKLGFETECLIERWRRPPGPLQVTNVNEYQTDLQLDHEAFGADRSRLLTSLALLGAVAVPGAGFAMSRPGANAAYVGPCIARTAETAAELLRATVARRGAEPLYWDLLPGNAAAVDLARHLGFTVVRRLERMVRPGVPGRLPLQTNASQVFAIAGFEYG